MDGTRFKEEQETRRGGKKPGSDKARVVNRERKGPCTGRGSYHYNDFRNETTGGGTTGQKHGAE